MDEKQKNFWIGTGIGAVIIIIIDLIIPAENFQSKAIKVMFSVSVIA